MRILAGICRVLIWAVLALSSIFQVLAVIMIGYYDDQKVAEGIAGSHPVDHIIICTVLMLAAVLVFFLLRRGKLFPMIAAGGLGVYFVWLANWIVKVCEMSAWNATWRHASMLLIPFLMIPVWLVHREDRRAAEAAAEAEHVPGILEDDGFRLSALPEEEQRPRNRKR